MSQSTLQPAPLGRRLRCNRLDQAQRRQLQQVTRGLGQVTSRSHERALLRRTTAEVETYSYAEPILARRQAAACAAPSKP